MIYTLNSSIIRKYIDKFPKDSEYYPAFQNLLELFPSLESDKSYELILSKTIFGYFLLTGSFQAYIFLNGKMQYRYGLNLVQDEYIINELQEKKYHENLVTGLNSEILQKWKVLSLQPNYQLYRLDFLEGKYLATLIFVNPIHATLSTYDITPIKNLVENYFCYKAAYSIHEYSNIFSSLKQQIIYDINKSFNDGCNFCVFTRFQIQDLLTYYPVMGEDSAREVLDKIMDIIKNKLEDNDILYRVGQRNFFVLSKEESESSVKKKFGDLFFQHKYIIINFRAHFFKIPNKITENSDFWPELFK
ncbi:MAG: hypothetical protein H7A25_12175 [Leptospiraceae bacterium]|nr:hypothetical protein [Leptospiraceae bacterium]